MKVLFKPITPIFVGSGEDYYPNDYVVFDEEIRFIDKGKFLDEVIKHNKYEKFLKVSENIDNLLDFIYELGDEIGYEKFCIDFIKGEDEALDKLANTISKPLSAFIKDKFLFKPIIPASTIKGTIRTALLDYLSKKFEIPKNIKNSKQLESYFFCDNEKFDAKKDILKALFISDFKPKNYELRIIKPKNRPFKKNKDNDIGVIVEALVNGEFEGEIRIDKRLLKSDRNLRENRFFQKELLSIELIKTALKEFYSNILKIENNRFRANTLNYQNYMIKIGKFAGGGSKSINEKRNIYIKQLKKNFNYQLSVWIDEYENPIGWGKLEFKNI